MATPTDTPHIAPYASDILIIPELTEADYERGQQFTEGIALLLRSGVELSNLDIHTDHGSAATMIIELSQPELRTVMRAEQVHQWAPPPEETVSSAPLIVHYLKAHLFNPNSIGDLLLETHSPDYPYNPINRRDLRNMKEVSVIDPRQHKIAIVMGRLSTIS